MLERASESCYVFGNEVMIEETEEQGSSLDSLYNWNKYRGIDIPSYGE